MTKRSLPAYVYRRTSRGRAYLYFERPGMRVRITAEPGTKDFALQYAKLLNGVVDVPNGKSMSALVRQYQQSERYRKLAPRTRKDYDGVLTYITGKLGHLPVDGWRTKDVTRAPASNAGTVRFANYIVQVLSVLFEHARMTGWREDNPAKGVPMLKSGRNPREPWPADMIEAYRANSTGRARLIFELCLGTGQRIGDVLRMRWNDVQDGGIHVRQGKTGARLWIPITGPLRAALDATPKRGLAIVAQANGRPTSYRGAADLVMGVRRNIGAEAYDIHALRHTAVSALAEVGCSDELIMSVTGHSSAAMVKLYAGKARQISRATGAIAMLEQNENKTGQLKTP